MKGKYYEKLTTRGAKADISFSKYGEELIYTLHTHLTSPSFRLPSSDEIKSAAVCFISDTKNCSDGMFGYGEEVSGGSGSGGAPDYDLNDAERCRKEGYTLTSCAAGETPEGFCIYNSAYFARCVCPAGYKTCEPPYYGVGQACGNKYASCEEDTERACTELDSEFTDTCQDGWKVDPNNTCEYDETYGKCCNLCEGYDYTTIPEGYIADGDACVDCNGTSKYKIKINPCDGFQDCGVMGGDTGAKTCMSGSQIKYDNCKPCPNLGTLSSCPSPFTCTYEECSNRYYKSGCQSGYDWNASTQTCTPQCASTYKYTCTGANQTGGSGTSCGGKYTACKCSSGYDWSNGTCNKCSSSYKYACTGTGYSGGNGTACGGKYTACKCKSNYFWSGSSCAAKNTCMKGSQIGYILNSDMTVTSSKQSGKTPIGVVVCSYSGGGGQAIALKSIGTYRWGSYGTDISSLQNYTTNASAFKDYTSCKNSEIIKAAGSSSSYPAVWAAHNYTTTGTKSGDWCLPAPGIFSSIDANRSKINAGLTQAGESYLGNSKLWSSSETNENSAWASDDTDMANTEFGIYPFWSKSNNYNIRPVIGFCKSGYGYDKSTDSCKSCGSKYKYTCTSGSYVTGGSGTACGGKYTACKCSSGYSWSGSACKANSCPGYSNSYYCKSDAIDYDDWCLSGSSKLYRCSACNGYGEGVREGQMCLGECIGSNDLCLYQVWNRKSPE